MESTSSFLKSVTKRVWSPVQRPFRVCCHNREIRKGITAGTLEELKERVCQALLLSLSALSVSLVCEEDGTEVDSDEFLITLPDNTTLMALEPGQTWRPQTGAVVAKSQDHNKPRNGKDIARVTFDLYKMSPKDLFGSLSVKATFQGLYSVSADFQCLGPKKVIREALRVASTLLQAAGHLLITSASLIRRVIEGAEFWQPQRAEYTARWN
ncbi:cell death activator CIDE-B [Solea senegalensis]|uniref:Cell death activator CIDE-B n=2 Tax=Solea TaxID=28828 RepID=A0AAV6QU13_SOLSE|nr:cell death activator CIDE-B [Solea senegalensis]KAG7495570.1 cell death activator CIDE-B [Solea senegalensis]